MANKAALFGLLAGASLLANANAVELDPSLGCKANPAVVGQCFTVRGDIALFNGTPPVRIQPQKSKRLLGVLPAESEIMPADLRDQLIAKQTVKADMLVCPLSPPKRKAMQFVCVESATIKGTP